GFSVAAGSGRFGKQVKLGTEPIDCKVSGKDTHGELCVFEFAGSGSGPRVAHLEQDEWIYIIEGELDFVIGKKRSRLGAGESIFTPRKPSHAWATATGKPGKIINVYQPAGNIEKFFAEATGFKDMPTAEQVINRTVTQKQLKSLHKFFASFGM